MLFIKEANALKNLKTTHVFDICMYEDIIYVLCSDDFEKFLVVTYKVGFSLKCVYEDIISKRSTTCVRLKYNKNRIPDLVYFDVNYNLRVKIINLHDRKKHEITLSNVIVSGMYRCYDDILMLFPYGNKNMTLYNMSTYKMTTHMDYSCGYLGVQNGNKYYTMCGIDTIKILDIFNDEESKVVKFNTNYKKKYCNDEYSTCILFVIDDVVYARNYMSSKSYCYDLKNERHFEIDSLPRLLEKITFNTKGNKLYSVHDDKLIEYDIIKETLFKSANYIDYQDITIKTENNNE